MSDLSPQSDPKRTLLGRSHLSRFYEYTPHAFLCRCSDHGRDAPKLVLMTRRQLLGDVISCGCIKAKARKKKAAALA
jgi:hypothetical protein